jgi:hypothetical protein
VYRLYAASLAADAEARHATRSALRNKALQASILVAIVIVSSLVAASLGPGNGINSNSNSPPSPPKHTVYENQTGILQIATISSASMAVLQASSLVNGSGAPLTIAGGRSYNLTGAGLFAVVDWLQNVTFNVVSQPGTLPFQGRFVVSLPGSFRLRLAAGNYTFFARNAYYDLAAGITIDAGRTTLMNISVDVKNYPARQYVLSDPDSAGSVGPWGQVSMFIGGLSNSSGLSGIVLLRGAYLYPFAVLCTNCVPSPGLVFYLSAGIEGPPVAASVVSSHQADGGLWLNLRPNAPMSTVDMFALSATKVTTSFLVIRDAP